MSLAGKDLPRLRGRIVALLGAMLSLTGCATLERGATEDIPVQTSPSGALVTSTSGTSCIAPCSVAAPRMETVVIFATKPGYAKAVRVAESKRIAGTEGKASPMPSVGSLGRIVDARTNADFEHVPNVFSITLSALPSSK